MTDFTRSPSENGLQNMMNAWSEGSYSPVHLHEGWAETFVALEGALAFFTWPHQGDAASPNTQPGAPQCHIIQSGGEVRAMVVEIGQWHAMTAAPRALGYPGHAVVMEISGHRFDPAAAGKTLAPFAPALEGGINGDPSYFAEQLMPLCPKAGPTSTIL